MHLGATLNCTGFSLPDKQALPARQLHCSTLLRRCALVKFCATTSRATSATFNSPLALKKGPQIAGFFFVWFARAHRVAYNSQTAGKPFIIGEKHMTVRLWTKRDTQKTIRDLRRAKYVVERSSLGGYSILGDDGRLWIMPDGSPLFQALLGESGYLVRFAPELFS